MKLVYLSFFCLVLFVSILQSQEIRHKPLSEVLDRNGRIIPGTEGSFDASGYIMNTGKNLEPIFSPADNAGVWYALGSGMDNIVYSIAISGNDVYAVGQFSTAGGISASRIAKWDGSTWSALGSGLNNIALAIAISGSDIYVGGWFTTAGGISASHIAKWDGSTWSALGSGVNNTVFAITISDSDIYVGGVFATAGGISANGIAKWNGTTWSALGSGIPGIVRTITISGSDVYAGGTFPMAGGITVNNIAKWNGTAWSALGSGMNANVYSIIISDSVLYAGGNFTTAGGITANYIAKWNGTTWSSLGSGMNADVNAIVISGSVVYAGGSFTTAGGVTVNSIAKWNGTTWSPLGSGVNSGVRAITISGSDVYLGGAFTTAGGITVNRVAQWIFLSYPSLVSPANGATGLSLTPSLEWDSITGATDYRIQISNNLEFSAIVFDTADVVSTQLSVPSGKLAGGTLYYWRVCGRNSSGDGPWSPVYVFITSVSLPSVPALVNPVNNSVNLPLNPAFHWNNIINADYYRIQISTDSGFAASVIDDSALTNPYYEIFLIGLLHNNTKYYWKVRAKNAAGWGAYSSTWNFRTALLNQPALQFPGNTSIGNTQPINLQWTYIDGATSYRIQVATDSLFNNLVVNDSTVTGISKTVSGLNPLSWYYWRVRAKNYYGYSAYSAVWKFKTIGTPYYVLLYYPQNNSINIPNNITFKWYKTVEQTTLKSNPPFSNGKTDFPETITNYWFELTADTSGVPVIRDSTLTDTVRTVSSLSNFTNYYWRVKAKGSAGWGAFSYWYKFRTVQNLPFSLKVYLEGFWNGSSQVQDTVNIYLAKDSSGYILTDSIKLVLSSSGTANIIFRNADNGNYYIVIKHRNHLETWSRLSQNFITDIPVNYDFTTDSAKAYGFNTKKVGSVWMLFGGDPNQDGSIDAIDIQIFISQFGLQGYLSCDFNGDGDVNAQDVQIISSNFGLTKSVPGLILLSRGRNDILKEIDKLIREKQKPKIEVQ